MASSPSLPPPERRVRQRRKDPGLSETRLANSQRIARLGDWEYDLVNQHLLWSEEVYRILGLKREDCPPDSATFYRLVHPDDLALVHRQKNIAATGLRCVDFEHRIIRPDGEVRHIHQIAEMVYDEQGRQIRETGTLQDITDRKRASETLRQSEERFKLVARAVSDVVWDWNIPANTLWWSEDFLTVFGFAAHEIEPGIEAWSGRIHPEERARVIAALHHAIDSGSESWSADYRFQRKDGSYAFVQDRCYILRAPPGQAIRVVGGMRDLTEQKKLEDQYLRAQRMESIGSLAGGIAHDLNNMLAPIMMSIDLLRLDSDPRHTRILDIIYRSSRRGAELVRQILGFARGMDGQRIVIHLRPLIDDLEGIISQTFPRNIRITSHVAADLAPFMGDPTQLHQVLLNLAVNARDAMPHGGTLTLTARNITLDASCAGTTPERKAGAYVLLGVTDTGEGIPPALLARIFEPFFTTKAAGKGTGLGLATTHTIVKSHGGFLQVESVVGRGTTFKIYLPADVAPATTVSALPFLTDMPRGHDELVLVVDDEFSIREITRQTLEAFGYRVLTASDGAEAAAIYTRQSRQIGAVITDMMMPVMDGAATIQLILRANPDARIIAASGIDSGENPVKSPGTGVHDFLPKPYTAETLLRLLREVLDRPAAPAHRDPAGSNISP